MHQLIYAPNLPYSCHDVHASVASFTIEVNLRLAKHPLILNGRLANRGLTSSVKETTVRLYMVTHNISHLAKNSGSWKG